MERVTTNPTDYIIGLDDERSADLTVIDKVLVKAMPGRVRVLWEGVFWGGTEQTIIGYGDLVQERPKGEDVEWFIIGLALQKNHISLYVNAVKDRAYLGKSYADRLGKVKTGSANITFKSAEALDLKVLGELAKEAHKLSPKDRPQSK